MVNEYIGISKTPNTCFWKCLQNLTIKVQNEIWIGPWWNLSSNRGVDIMDHIGSHHRGVVHIFYKNDVSSK